MIARELHGWLDDEAWTLPSSVFGTLRRAWCEQAPENEQRTFVALARLLDVPPVSVTQWSTSRRAPWRVVRRLLVETGSSISISPTGFTISTGATDGNN